MFARFRWMPLAVLCLLLAAVALPDSPESPASRISPELAGLLLDLPTDATTKVWVQLDERGLQGVALTAALDRAEAELDPRAARRRAKVHQPGERLVDVRDLPLNETTLAACAATGARLHQRSRWLNAASFRATPEQVRRLAGLRGVRGVTPVRGLTRAAVPTPVGELLALPRLPHPTRDKNATAIAYGQNEAAMQQAGVPAAHDLGLSGAGVLVGMLDTGFRTTHEALAGIPVLAVWDFVNNDGIVDQETGDPLGAINHGTMTLSTVAGNMPGQLVAPAFGAAVVLAKTEDIAVEVPLEEDNWVAGLEWAEGLGADIVSSSLGYVEWYTYEELDGDTAVTAIAADLAVARGLVVVTSAGNDRGTTGHLIAPADADSVVTVGAVDDLGDVSWFSSPGPTVDGRIKPDVAALGVANTVTDPTDDTNYFGANGTSFSCPLTSGVVALMLERVPQLTPIQVRDALRATASQSTAPDNDLGWGIIDAAAAVTWFGPVFSHDLLPQTSDPVGPYLVTATLTDRLGLDGPTAVVRYRTGGGPWQEVPLLPAGPADTYTAAIPGQPLQSDVDYYLTAASVNGVASSLPFAGDGAPYHFIVAAPSAVDPDRLPAATRLAANVPNPFNPQTSLNFSLGRSGRASLRIYDVRGQLVRTLLDAELAAGPHRMNWDGRDDSGRAQASGTYFARLVRGPEVQQRKMQLVR